MFEIEPTVFIIDDEPEMCRSLELLFRSASHEAESFSSAEEFLESYDAHRPGCIVLDMRLGGMSGVELQRRLVARGRTMPIIMISGHATVSTVVDAIKEGAIDFLEKPFDDDVLLSKVANALSAETEGRFAGSKVRARLDSLSPREREVMDLLVEGRSARQVAEELGISPKTVDKHRMSLLQKMRADSVVELVNLVAARK